MVISVKYWCEDCWELKYVGFAGYDSSDDAPTEYTCPDCGAAMTKGQPKGINFGGIVINKPPQGGG